MGDKKRGRTIGTHPKFRSEGNGIIWPKGVEEYFGISKTTRWLWEQHGKLPARDVYIGGQLVGWKPSTIKGIDNKPITTTTVLTPKSIKNKKQMIVSVNVIGDVSIKVQKIANKLAKVVLDEQINITVTVIGEKHG